MRREEHTPAEILPGDLPGIWRQRAEFLKEYGSDPSSGRLWALAATELDAALKVLGETTLTLKEAAALCGYSTDHLGTLVRNGTIRNFGHKGSPRIRRSDLPTKSTTSPGRPQRRKVAAGDVDIGRITTK
jgi:hypothetical protein